MPPNGRPKRFSFTTPFQAKTKRRSTALRAASAASNSFSLHSPANMRLAALDIANASSWVALSQRRTRRCDVIPCQIALALPLLIFFDIFHFLRFLTPPYAVSITELYTLLKVCKYFSENILQGYASQFFEGLFFACAALSTSAKPVSMPSIARWAA
jgi:hypothetical protein